MYTLTLSNEKGGVGKTTAAITIAAGAAIMGKRVLLIDSDAQGHSGFQLGVESFGGLYRLLVQDAAWKDVLRTPARENWAGEHTTDGTLLVLPSNVETRGIPLMVSEVDLLMERLEELEGYIDLVVIDTSPTPSLLHAMIYFASDGIIFPSECEALSLDGLAKTFRHMLKESEKRVREGRAPLNLLGVQPTMYDNRTNAHRYGLEMIREHFGEARTWDPIPMRTAWRDAAYSQQSIFAYSPDEAAAGEAWGLVERVMGVAING